MAHIKIVAAHPATQATREHYNGYLYIYHATGAIDVYFRLDENEMRLLPEPNGSLSSRRLMHLLHEHMNTPYFRYDNNGQDPHTLVASYHDVEREKPFGTTNPHTIAEDALKQLKAAFHWLATRAV